MKTRTYTSKVLSNLPVYLEDLINGEAKLTVFFFHLLFVEGVITGKSKSGKPEAVKKGTTGLKSRNALNDITNKSTALPEEAAKKKSSQKEVKVPSELNIAEETFQHDHKKCVEAQKSGMTRNHFMDLVLPGCGNFFSLLGCQFCSKKLVR